MCLSIHQRQHLTLEEIPLSISHRRRFILKKKGCMIMTEGDMIVDRDETRRGSQ